MQTAPPSRSSWVMVFALAALLALTFPQPAAAAPGDPDLTFHGQGWTTTPANLGSTGFKFAVQEDGRFMVVGSGGPSLGEGLVLNRFLADGSPDLSYFPVSPAGPGRFVQAVPAIALQPDGKLLVSGLAVSSSDSLQIALLRYLPDGSLDQDFGEGRGFVTIPAITSHPPKCLALQNDGRILLSTFMNVLRFEPSGTRDTSFVEPESGGVVKVLSDGKIIRGWRDVGFLGVQRLFPGGTPDLTFGGNGTALVEVPASLAPVPPGLIEEDFQVEELPDGRIWIGGQLRRGGVPSQPPIVDDLFVMRLLPNGTPDTGFNGSGVAVFNNGNTTRFAGIMPQPHGALILAGETDRRVNLTYLRQDGTPDTRFGAAGRVVSEYTGLSDSWYGAAIAPEPQRRIMVAGMRSSGSVQRSLLLRRYLNLLETAAVVEYPPGTELKDAPAQPMDFGIVPPGGRIREFTLRNAGSKPLSGLTISLADESHPGEYVVRQPVATTLAPDGQTTFLVILTPLQSSAPRTATLRITGRDADTPEDLLLFSTGLTGRLATALEVWRNTWFGTTDNAGFAADLTDFDGDGLVNLMEYALGANPHKFTPSSARAVRNGNALEYTYTRPAAALTEVDYLPEAAADPAGPWSTTGLTSTMVSEADGLQTVLVSAPLPDNAGRRFVRLRVSRR